MLCSHVQRQPTTPRLVLGRHNPQKPALNSLLDRTGVMYFRKATARSVIGLQTYRFRCNGQLTPFHLISNHCTHHQMYVSSRDVNHGGPTGCDLCCVLCSKDSVHRCSQRLAAFSHCAQLASAWPFRVLMPARQCEACMGELIRKWTSL